MQITILGGSGKTGKELVKQALSAGHQVIALVRNPDSLPPQANLTIIQGNVTKVEDVATASKGSQVIISTLGSMAKQSTLIRESIEAVISASQTTNLSRFIQLSSFAVRKEQLSFFMKLMSGMMKDMVSDKSAGENLLQQSNMDWTIVYATRLTDGAQTANTRIVPDTEKIGMGNQITRSAVANWLLNEATNHAYSKTQVTITQ